MLLALAILIAVACCIREDWMRLRAGDSDWDASLARWFCKGAIFPAAAWGIVNLGVSERFPAFIPNLAIAQSSGAPWGGIWVGVAIAGAGFIAISWAAVTYAWMMFAIAQESGDTPEFRKLVTSLGI